LKQEGNGNGKWNVEEIAGVIDHAILRPEKTEKELDDECEVARGCGVATVCVRPFDVSRAADLLKGSGTGVSSVVGFPHGSSVTGAKVEEAARALEEGAKELDVVSPIGKVRSGKWEYLEYELEGLVNEVRKRNAVLKVILECYYLTREEISRFCMISELLEVDFVKTSTGFAPAGASLEQVQLMREACSDRVSIKAAGGIRTLEDLLGFCRAGADRIGTSSTEKILREARDRRQ